MSTNQEWSRLIVFCLPGWGRCISKLPSNKVLERGADGTATENSESHAFKDLAQFHLSFESGSVDRAQASRCCAALRSSCGTSSTSRCIVGVRSQKRDPRSRLYRSTGCGRLSHEPDPRPSLSRWTCAPFQGRGAKRRDSSGAHTYREVRAATAIRIRLFYYVSGTRATNLFLLSECRNPNFCRCGAMEQSVTTGSRERCVMRCT